MEPGDYVKIELQDETIQGILLPRPEILDQDMTIIKLDTGYNIGIETKKIKKSTVLKPYELPKKNAEGLKNDPKLPNVTVLSTGGTISSKIDYKTGGVYADYTAEDFVQMVPELALIANLKAKKVMSTMSEELNGNDWIAMAQHVTDALKEGTDGIVLTMGTDMLGYTAAALSFLLKDLDKPVIITASQRSIDRGSSDAFMNLLCAVRAAAEFDGAGVMTCMHGSSNDDYCYLIRGTKVRKMHTSRRDAFRPINELPFAKVFPDVKKKIEIINKKYDAKSSGASKVSAETKFEEKVALIHVHPYMDPEVISYYLDKGIKGIVLSATALGHVPVLHEKYSLLPQLEKAKQKKVPVVIASQTLYGRVHAFVYSTLRKLFIEENCIFAEDMLPETALLKLSWILGQTTDYAKVREMMLTNYHGEINEIIDEKSFLN